MDEEEENGTAYVSSPSSLFAQNARLPSWLACALSRSIHIYTRNAVFNQPFAYNTHTHMHAESRRRYERLTVNLSR